jgi:hypothetical protein
VAEPSVGGEPVEAGGAPIDAGGAHPAAGGAPIADARPAPLSKFDRDTAVWRSGTDRSQHVQRTLFAAEVSPDWRAGRGPHGGYLAAMLLRALVESVADSERAPRSLTIHYARAPEPGPVQITTTIEREGRSLSTLSARMHQGEDLVALVLAAFSVPWGGPEISDIEMPPVDPQTPRAMASRWRSTAPRISRATSCCSRASGACHSRMRSGRWNSAAGLGWQTPARSTRCRWRSSATR